MGLVLLFLTQALVLLLFRGASTAEDIGHRVIAFMARVFEELVTRVSYQGHRDGPRPDPGFGDRQ